MTGALLAGCGPTTANPTAPPAGQAPAPRAPGAASAAAGLPATPVATAGGLTGFAFNSAGRSVTLFDVATRQVLATKPLGATVRWLSNEQRFWDGRYIWTYDYPEDLVQAVVIDPRTVGVVRTIPTDGRGPAHGLMLTPDRKTAWVNVATDDFLAAIDVASGQVADVVRTGKFP